jgi:membrane-bound metal-dependent hydrolase YbcI (DUF457 family)
VGGAAVLALAVFVCLVDKALIRVLLAGVVCFVLVAACRALLATAKHRLQTHSPIALLVVLLPNLYIARSLPPGRATSLFFSVWLGFSIGWLSHLIADTFNKKGVPWLYPLSRRHFHIAKVVTGSAAETLFRFGSVACFMALYAAIVYAAVLAR